MTNMPPLALLAGGLATRMRPLTETIPKSMLEVAGEPFIAHQLRKCRREGIGRIVICAGFLGTAIRDFAGSGADFGLEIAYSFDGEPLLGTGGALKKAASLMGPEFLIMYGDSWLDIPYVPVVDAFRASGKDALMTVYRNQGQWDASNVSFSEGKIHSYDKKKRTPDMHHIDWGLGLMRSAALKGWPENEAFDLASVYQRLLAEDRLAGYEVHERFYEIGSAMGLAETDALLRAG